ncbi:MAG: cytochrome c biogenesis protein CcdA, partial [Bdellovibrionota bacterium]
MEWAVKILESYLGPDAGMGGLLIALPLAYLGGVLSSLTPCVYPMIPITVGVVTGMPPNSARSKGAQFSWGTLILRGGAYVAGMCVVYSLLGVAAGVSGQVFGTLTNTPGWYLTLGIIVSLSALAMLEVIPFDPPAWIDAFSRKLGIRSKVYRSEVVRETTLGSAFVLGATSGLIASPCTTPVLTAILAYIAKTQSVLNGFLLMFFFSLGLGTLLLLVAGFAGAIQVLHKSGTRMKAVKQGGG